MVDSDRYSAMLAELGRQRAELDRACTALSTLTARATSVDRLITVTVNSRGLLVDLSIEPLALRRYRSEQLSEAITGLVAKADESLRRQRESLLKAVGQPEPTLADVPKILEPNGSAAAGPSVGNSHG